MSAGIKKIVYFDIFVFNSKKFGSMDELAALIHHAAEESKAYFAAQH